MDNSNILKHCDQLSLEIYGILQFFTTGIHQHMFKLITASNMITKTSFVMCILMVTVLGNPTLSHPPPYPPSSFDKILLDAPCSALGQRPCLGNPITEKQLSSIPPVQRKLLSTAVKLLKPGGTLVYSTCTFVSEENEEQIAWLLNHFPEMCLESQVN